MSQRPFLKVDPNSSVVVKLLYDEGVHKPATDPKYDDQYFWGVAMGDDEYVIAATPRLNEMLLEFKKDAVVEIGKAQTEKGGQAFYVKRYTGDPAVKPSDQIKPNQSAPPQNQPTQNNGVDWDLKNAKTEHSISKAVCLKLAVNSFAQGDFNEPEIIKRYQTLLTILDDDLDTALIRLQQAKNVFHLNAIASKHGKLWRAILSPDEVGQVIDEVNRLKEAFKNPVEKIADIEVEPLNTDGGKLFGSQSPLQDDDEPLPF